MRASLFRRFGWLGVAWLLVMALTAGSAQATVRRATVGPAEPAVVAAPEVLPQFKISAPATLVRYDHEFVYEVRSLEVMGVPQGENAYWHCTGICHGSLLHPRTLRRADSVRFSGFRFYFDSKASLEVYVLGKGRNDRITSAIGRIEDAGVTIHRAADKHYSFSIFQRFGCLRAKETRDRVKLKIVACPTASPSGTSSGTGSGSPGTGSGSPGSGSGSPGSGGSGSSGSGSGSTPVLSPTGISAPAATAYTYGVTLRGSGNGDVSAPGLSCSASTCSGSAISGQVVTLTESPSAGSTFSGWAGACSGTAATCSFVLSSSVTATATFGLDQEPVTVSDAGTGTGTVAGTGISCGSTCSTTVGYGQPETLVATPDPGSAFVGWGGACNDARTTCSFVPNSSVTATATFRLDQEPVTVSDAGTGTGTVSGTGISCGSTCSTTVGYGQPETLVATASTGSTFTGWSGACHDANPTCAFFPSSGVTATATFELDQEPVTVSDAGTGTGTVSGTGISCGSTCSTTVGYGQPETLVATASTGSTFTGWSGACSGVGTCMLAPTEAAGVTATFTTDMETLTVVQSGPAQGSVSGGGISCGATCSVTVPYGTTISLTASAPWDVEFGGWQGADCSGAAGCNVTMTSDMTVGAPFSGYYETATSDADTWSDPTTAGGTQGPTIDFGQTVQVACVIQGLGASIDGNPNWYQVTESPWDSAFYVSADSFLNSDPTLSSLFTTPPPVDPAVPAC